MIAVTFALPTESSDFTRLLENPTRVRRAGIEVDQGTLHGQAISVVHTGVGEQSTRARLATFLGEETPAALISTGFAGALHESLAVGDLVLSDNHTAPTLLATAQRALADTAKIGTLATAHSVIDSVAARQQIAQETGAAAVDMETEFIAELCAAFGIPMISLRAITDTPSAPFPAPPRVLFNLERQRTEFAPLFWYLFMRPTAIPRFLAFAGRIARCRKTLAAGLDRLLREPLVRPESWPVPHGPAHP